MSAPPTPSSAISISDRLFESFHADAAASAAAASMSCWCARRIAGQLRVGETESEREGHEPLLGAVVKVALEALARLVGSVREPRT